MKADTTGRSRPVEPSHFHSDRFDEADWLDWNHWQAVEEFQNIVDGLSSSVADQERDTAQPSDDRNWAARLSRQLRRQGLEVDS